MNLDPEISQDELKIFLQEAYEQIELMDEDIVILEKEKDNPDLIQEIFRAAHTIKGSSAMVGHQTMTELTHAMENLLDKIRNHELSVTTEIIDSLLYSLDILKVLVNDIDSSVDSNQDIKPALQKLKEVTDVNSKSSSPEVKGLVITQEVKKKVLTSQKKSLNAYRISVGISEESDWPTVRSLQCLNELDNVGEVVASYPSEEELGDEDVNDLKLEVILISSEEAGKVQGLLSTITDIKTVEVTPYTPDNEKGDEEVTDTETREVPIANENAVLSNDDKISKLDSSKQEGSQSVRVDVEILDSLLNVVEELVIDRSKISQVGKNLEEKYPGDILISELSETSDHIIKTINELQEYIMQVRMVPIGTIFSRFPRMVRDLAQTQKKKLDFIIEGADTELDRTIIEQIRDPITHILRNAVDHGIEPLEIRQSSGKPETATIRLKAYREQSQIIIQIEDDGKGINTDKVIESAINKGLLSQAKAESLTETEAINLIFLPGMSTAEKATEVSGRGVGMDIVRANVESLGGSTNVETEIGKGSRFTIRLPLTVAIVQGFLTSVDNAIYILPMGSIAETMSIDPSIIQSVQGREIIRWRDSLIPLVRLSATFTEMDNKDEVKDKLLIVVVTSDTGLIGLVIDELFEPQEIVVKSLGNYLGDVEGIAGATILGDGRVALILDVNSLVKTVVQSGSFSTITRSGSMVGI